MVRYAEWREAIDPERPLERFDPLVRLSASLLAAAVAGGACCGCLSIPLFLWVWTTLGKEQHFKRVARLRDSPPAYLQIASRLILEQGGTAYGKDEGIVSLVDGGLLFEGRQTSFSARREEIELEGLSRKGLSFRFPSPSGPCRAILAAYEEEDLRLAIDVWTIRDGEPGGFSVLPPCVPERHVRRRVEGLRALSVSVGVGGVLLSVLWAAIVDPAGGFTAALCTAVSSGVGWLLTEGKRRHLDRLEQRASVGDPHRDRTL